MSRPNLIRDAYLAGDLSPADLLAFHRRTFGDARMEGDDGDPKPDATPEQPSGVSDEEWGALGDKGKAAIVRERAARTRAEQDLAAARSTPKPTPPNKGDEGEKPKADPGKGAEQDVASLIEKAVQAAVAPLLQRDEQRETQDRARAVAEAVTDAAATKLHDQSDALAYLDLTSLTDGNGNADATKITSALDDLVQRKPHLAKVVDTSRRPGAGSLLGGGQAPAPSVDDQVKAALAHMQASAGVKLAGA